MDFIGKGSFLFHFLDDHFSCHYYYLRNDWRSISNSAYRITQGHSMKSCNPVQILAKMQRQPIQVSNNIQEHFPELANVDENTYMWSLIL